MSPSRNSDDSVRFLVLGDPGEGDFSQYAVVTPLLAVGSDTDFMVVASDVIYPAGDINEYPMKFYRPYSGYRKPIFATPGNHDWDDGGLVGFMYHFCNAEEQSGQIDALLPFPRWIWHPLRRKTPNEETVRARVERREIAPVEQPAPYFAIDAGPVTIVCIDTGLGQEPLDADQADWLRRVSASSTPKILITGKPLIVNGAYHPNDLEGGGTVDDIVRDSQNSYIAAIGGDVHNYQRYVVRTSGDSWMPYIVAGGGGAFMSGTHDLGPIHLDNKNATLPPIGEDDFRCYPRRGDSLATFTYLYAARSSRAGLGLSAAAAALGAGALITDHSRTGFGLEVVAAGLAGASLALRLWPDRVRLRPGAAERYISQRTGIAPARPSGSTADDPTALQRLWADLTMAWPPGKASRQFYSPLWDWDRPPPPLFKSFLRIDASMDSVSIRAFAATGCAEHYTDPPIEDHLTWQADAGWRVEPIQQRPDGAT